MADDKPTKTDSSMRNTAKADTTPLDDIDLDFGDLSKFVDEEEDSAGHQLGNLSAIDDDDDLIGDLSLLDEAIAELDSKQEGPASKPTTKAASEAESAPASEMELSLETDEQQQSRLQDAPESAPVSAMNADDDIPVLTDSVAEVSHSGDTEVVDFETPDTVPLLGESSIVGEGSQFNATPEQAAEEQDATVDEEAPLSQLGDIAEELLSGTQDEELSLVDEEQSASQATSDSNLSPDDSIFDNSLFESTPEEAAEETPVAASSNISPDDSIFDNSLFESTPAEEEAVKSSFSEQVSSFTAGMHERRAARGGFSSELHAQLSKKIDSLVLEAIESLSEELHSQLATRMEELLMSSVDSALPPLMENFASGLRKEVQNKVHKKMPQIVNELLGEMEVK